jgi:hypothetical protein
MEKATSKMLKPDTKAYSLMMSEILTHSGELLNSYEITKVLVDAYNHTIQQKILDDTEGAVLMVTLDLYVTPIIKDKDIMMMVQQHLSDVLDRASRKQN